MVKGSIRKLMVVEYFIIGDFYVGGFKNGLKHG